MGRRKKIINKELIAEDWCFECKDGGLLRVCDYKDCLKAFHPRCVDEDDLFLESKIPWSCRWHSCFICKKNTPKFHCFCCPKAVCGRCFCDAEFAVVRGKRGFCSHCSTLAGFLEGINTPDSALEKIDFDDRETYEFNFKGYWEMTKEKEGLTLKHVLAANKLLSMDENSGCLSDPNDIFEEEDISEYEENQTISDDDGGKDRKRRKGSQKCKRNKGKQCTMERKVKSQKKLKGWGSELLFDFLASIGKDTSNALSQHEVTEIVIRYCNEHKLYHPEKKKKVICDVRLKSLFRRKSINKNSIYNLLTSHFAENLEQSEEECGYSSEDKGENVSIECKRQKTSSSNRKSQDNEPSPDVKRGRFASMNAENIKLLYLKRSLVEALAKQPDTFDAKVIGSFVRAKSDPNDYLQKNPYQLLKVTGIKRGSKNAEVNTDIFIQASNMPKDIPICKLSDDNFSEEECEDLRQRVKDSRLERPTVVESEEKARSLHEDIIKHWIVKELALLQKQIDQANEKGWRRELDVYMNKLMLLRTPSEQSRLLLEVPEIIADVPEIKPADTDMDLSKEDGQENITPLESDLCSFSQPSGSSPIGNGANAGRNDTADFAEQKQQLKQPEPDELVHYSNFHKTREYIIHQRESNESAVEVKQKHPEAASPEPLSEPLLVSLQHQSNSNSNSKRPESDELVHHSIFHATSDNGVHQTESHEYAAEVKQNHPEAANPELLSEPLLVSSQDQSNSNSLLPGKQHFPGTISENKQDKPVDLEHEKEEKNPIAIPMEIIDLSDDEEQDTRITATMQTPVNLDSRIWYCMSPHGIKKGPCSMSVLKEWSDSCPYDLKFKVWKTGQNPEEATLLTDVIRQIYFDKQRPI